MAGKNVLVVGATGVLGGLVVRELLAKGHRVRAFVRPHTDAKALESLGVGLARGDLKHPETLPAALAGVDVVVSTANSASRGGDDTPESVDLRGNASLVAAAAKAGVAQFVFVSAYGASPASPIPFIRAKAETEARLKASGMPYTILRPDMFAEAWCGMLVGMPLATGQPATFIGNEDVGHTFVSVSDVAKVAVATVGNADALGRTFNVGGPEYLTWRQVVAAFERASGRMLPIRTLPRSENVPNLPPFVSDFIRHFESDSNLDMQVISRRLGVSLTPFDTTVRRMLAPPA